MSPPLTKGPTLAHFAFLSTFFFVDSDCVFCSTDENGPDFVWSMEESLQKMKMNDSNEKQTLGYFPLHWLFDRDPYNGLL